MATPPAHRYLQPTTKAVPELPPWRRSTPTPPKAAPTSRERALQFYESLPAAAPRTHVIGKSSGHQSHAVRPTINKRAAGGKGSVAAAVERPKGSAAAAVVPKRSAAAALPKAFIPRRTWKSDFRGAIQCTPEISHADNFEWQPPPPADRDPVDVLAEDLEGDTAHVRCAATDLLPTELDGQGVPTSLTLFQLRPDEVSLTEPAVRARLCDAIENAIEHIERALDPYRAVPASAWPWNGHESNPCRTVTNQKPCQS